MYSVIWAVVSRCTVQKYLGSVYTCTAAQVVMVVSQCTGVYNHQYQCRQCSDRVTLTTHKVNISEQMLYRQFKWFILKQININSLWNGKKSIHICTRLSCLLIECGMYVVVVLDNVVMSGLVKECWEWCFDKIIWISSWHSSVEFSIKFIFISQIVSSQQPCDGGDTRILDQVSLIHSLDMKTWQNWWIYLFWSQNLKKKI